MRANSSLLTTLLLATITALSCQAHTASGMPGNTDEPGLTWTGRIEENGEPTSFTGSSLQQIEAQIREIKPGFSWSHITELTSDGAVVGTEGDILCNLSWNPPYASVFHIRQGVSYLHKIPGDCNIGPGPANCTRVSCSYSSGIWFCNDSPQLISVPCATLGDRAYDIVDKCYAYGTGFPTDSVVGQVFDTANWNVIVAGVDC
ncbi:hypothetical protein GGR50DRAFT_696875 [Xylaria sp. CBS 124048]|nr:hypothetical protein GGR50DRAFT_696875 [Xylaria sp. CBS 124048]